MPPNIYLLESLIPHSLFLLPDHKHMLCLNDNDCSPLKSEPFAPPPETAQNAPRA